MKLWEYGNVASVANAQCQLGIGNIDIGNIPPEGGVMLTSREVAKSSLAALGFLALDGLPVFAAPAGWKAKSSPNLVLGVMSDSHLRVGYDAVTPGRAYPLKYIHNAFKLFKNRGIDAFVHCGDAAHRGCVREWEFHKELLDKVFGKRGGPERIVIVGNHELFEHAKVWWPNDCRAEDGGNDLDHDGEGSSLIKVKAEGSDERIHNKGFPSRQAMVVNVYDDMVVFERHEVGEGGKLGPDWVLPLGECKMENGKCKEAEKGKACHPFSREGLLKTIGAPEFPPKAKLEVSSDRISKIDRIESVGKRAQNGNPDNRVNPVKNEPALHVKIPMADGSPASRVYAYNVVVVGDDIKARYFKSVFFSGVNSGIGHEPNGGVTKVDMPLSQLPAGKKLTIAARPLSSLGTKGKAIGTTWRI